MKVIQTIERVFDLRSLDFDHHRVKVGNGDGAIVNAIESCSFTSNFVNRLSGGRNEVRVTVEVLERDA